MIRNDPKHRKHLVISFKLRRDTDISSKTEIPNPLHNIDNANGFCTSKSLNSSLTLFIQDKSEGGN